MFKMIKLKTELNKVQVVTLIIGVLGIAWGLYSFIKNGFNFKDLGLMALGVSIVGIVILD